MATSLRTVLNRALVAIGEAKIDPAASALTTSTQLKLLEFLNEIKEEIEAAGHWRALRQYLTVTLTANTTSATVAGSNERSRLIRVPATQINQFVPLVFDITDPTNPIQLVEMNLAELEYRLITSGSQAVSTQPSFFALGSVSDATVINVYPKPSVQRSIQLVMTVPQDELDETDIDTNILIPSFPLIKGTVWYAREDRGEELGPQGVFTEERYRTSLDDAISLDNTEQGDQWQMVTT